MSKTMQPGSTITKTAFELKGSFLTLTVLHLLQTDTALITDQLTRNAKKTPNLFKHMPIIIDLQKVNQMRGNINFHEINIQLRQLGFVPVGVRNGNDEQHESAIAAGLGILTDTKRPTEAPTTATTNNTSQAPQTHLITKPIRSGQQIYARNANLIVLANVSHGAELLADGCIHVYSTLRGRALAGVTGDKSARIFCQKLEAELVSIAGYYKLKDDIKPPPDSFYTQIYLQNDQLQINNVTLATEKG